MSLQCCLPFGAVIDFSEVASLKFIQSSEKVRKNYYFVIRSNTMSSKQYEAMCPHLLLIGNRKMRD